MIRRIRSVGNREMPKHIAITAESILEWSRLNKASVEDAYSRSVLVIKSTMKTQVRLNIPIVTLSVLHKGMEKDESFPEVVDSLVQMFSSIAGDKTVHDNQVKISFLGKWYDLPGRLVDAVKKVIEETKDYDRFFLNFCLNYDGQEEIVDACRLMARQIRAEKLDPESVRKGTIKENLYSSYFLPPDLIIKNGKEVVPDLLLWDHVNAKLFFTKKMFPDFDKDDIEDALKYYSG